MKLNTIILATALVALSSGVKAAGEGASEGLGKEPQGIICKTGCNRLSCLEPSILETCLSSCEFSEIRACIGINLAQALISCNTNPVLREHKNCKNVTNDKVCNASFTCK